MDLLPVRHEDKKDMIDDNKETWGEKVYDNYDENVGFGLADT